MREDEIMLALKKCSEEHIVCQTCPLFGETWCHRELAKNTLSLIEEKNAENERLQKYNTDMAFKHYNDGMKEFAERLKERNKIYCINAEDAKEMDFVIDNLVKEMECSE